jgi:hypothetical protein
MVQGPWIYSDKGVGVWPLPGKTAITVDILRSIEIGSRAFDYEWDEDWPTSSK